MDRRAYLAGAAGMGGTLVGGAAVYTLHRRTGGFERDVDARDGWLLSGVAPSAQDRVVLEAFEEWLQRRHAVVGTFADIGFSAEVIDEVVYALLDTTWAGGQVPHLWWQPFIPNPDDTPMTINQEIAAGDHDELLARWATALADWAMVPDGPDRRVYLNLAPEMNGDWVPWSPALGEDDEDDFVAMWHRVHDIVMRTGLGAEHVQWIWAIDTDNMGVDREALYPGDDYVDWIGLHGYNWVEWNGWQTPQEVYGESIEVLRSIAEKPLAITEFGCSSAVNGDDHDPARKDAWITDAYEYFRSVDVRMALWFNLTKETDWAVFDAEVGVETATVDGEEFEVYPAYREVLAGDGVLGPRADHDRVLADAEFRGEF